VQLEFSREDEQFREQVADWLRDNLCGSFESIRGRGGPGDEHHFVDERKDWERCLSEGGWTCIGWPEEWGGRGASIEQQVIFNEEYARAGGPGRMGHIGETLTGPTLLAFGSDDQKRRFLPDIRSGQSFWCQGYSEPAAGSDLSNIKTRAEWDDEAAVWRFYGQKVWTSLAQQSDFIFVLARTDPAERGHRGLGFFLVPLAQEGIDIRPINQLTGTAEFNEVFLTARLVVLMIWWGKPETAGAWRWACWVSSGAYQRWVSKCCFRSNWMRLCGWQNSMGQRSSPRFASDLRRPTSGSAPCVTTVFECCRANRMAPCRERQ
jgi:alkylation response protein AidB-like acyl-CoA dehydrogenase